MLEDPSLSGHRGELGGPLQLVAEAGEFFDEPRVGLVQRSDLLLLHQDHPLLLTRVGVLSSTERIKNWSISRYVLE